MAITHRVRFAAAAILATSALFLTACSTPAADTVNGKVVVTVGGLPGKDQKEPRAHFLAQVADFEKANPTIQIKPVEWVWAASTFSAQLAGKSLPTVFQVPFTESKNLISQKQFKDITKWVKTDPKLGAILPAILKPAQDAHGNFYAVPTFATQNGLLINRALFQKAGLNPDEPITSWPAVADAAKKITAATGKTGFCQLTTKNQGGWILTSIIAAMGSELESRKGDTFTATIDTPAAKDALKFLKTVRWDDNAAGSNFLIDFSVMGPQFATGGCGMMVGPDGWLGTFVQSGMNTKDFGMFPMPQASNGLGGLGGGTLTGFRPDATDKQVDAGVKWIDFQSLDKYYNADQAVAGAKALAASGQPVPDTFYSIVAPAQYSKYLKAISSYVNVPIDNVKSYRDATTKLPVVSEPQIAGQQVYALLDSVIQAVLTRQDADIDQLLADAQKQAEPLVAAGQK